jgi:outer membrane protein assembly factor BamB
MAVVVLGVILLSLIAAACQPVTPVQPAQMPINVSNTAPTLSGSPWPTFRHDSRSTGFSPIRAAYAGDKPWMYQTGKGIFSTPVIDDHGTVYAGSADHFFYALNADGTLKWKYETGEIIDSAGALGAFDPSRGYSTITFISGDGKMYRFRTDDVPLEQRQVWVYEAQLRPGVSYNRWFEGNVAVGPDGTLYAGNTNFNYYAINPDGTLKWTYETASNNWSQAAFGADGTIYWGSLDTYIRGVKPDGKELWRTRTLGFIAASAAVGSDGTVYMGSFDSNMYALDPKTGSVKWKFGTADHIYASAALDSDDSGNTTAIYFGSADGTLYALRPDGSLLWKYDTGDVIRSSPVIGLAPSGSGRIIYFGCGNGKLYALDSDGKLRWAFDTTSTVPELRDRNDLNGSPALGKTGIYIGGEHGQLWYIPYDYCLNANDARCASTQAFPDDFTGLYYVTPGGNTQGQFPDTLPTSAMLTLRLVVRKGGQTVNARLCDSPVGCPRDSLVAEIEPAVPLVVDHSADGHYIYIRPGDFLAPGQDYKLRIRGKYYIDGLRIGNMTLGGSEAGSFQGQYSFRSTSTAGGVPLSVSSDQVTGLEWTRLAAPIPTMLPSLNQIGFDYIDWLVGPVAVTAPDSSGRGKFILWAIGARHDNDGRLVPDPSSDFTIPLNGRYQGPDFIMRNQDFPMAITGIKIPFNLFELRGQLDAGGVTSYPAAFADTDTLGIPTFGPYMVIAGLANNWYQKLLVSGTYVTRLYDGPANHAPQGIHVTKIDFQSSDGKAAGQVAAEFSLDPGASYPIKAHRAALLLVDPDKNEAVYMDYLANLSTKPDTDGNLKTVTLTIPAATKLPARVQVYVMLDVFPEAQKSLDVR